MKMYGGNTSVAPTSDDVEQAATTFREELEMKTEGNRGIQKVSFKTYYLKTVKRMRAAYDICQPSGELSEEETALASGRWTRTGKVFVRLG